MHDPQNPNRPRVPFDADQRRRVLDMVSAGASRRRAAERVGCAPSTITRAAQRDPIFAEELFQAENALEFEAVQFIRHAAREPRYWRAAAWLLERKNPDSFAAHRPTPEPGLDPRTAHLLAQALMAIVDELPTDNRDRALQKLEAIFTQIQAQQEDAEAQAQDAPPTDPNLATHTEPESAPAASEATDPESNIQNPQSNISHPPSDIQNPTSNIQHPRSNPWRRRLVKELTALAERENGPDISQLVSLLRPPQDTYCDRTIAGESS